MTLVSATRFAASCRRLAAPIAMRRGLSTKALTIDTMNQLAVAAEYAVRGRLPMRAAEIKEELSSSPGKYPFDELVFCNIGNPQSVGMVPLTFNREVLALLMAPHLLAKGDEMVKAGLMSAEAVARAKEYQSKGANVGAYTDSIGFKFVRDEVCDMLEARDGHRVDANHVFLTNGASEGVRLMMTALGASHLGGKVGIMTPIPQYPLYSALTTMIDGEMVGYYLDESKGWAISEAELQKQYDAAEAKGIKTRALVVINPGNPSGANLDEATLATVAKFAHEKKLVLMADEVYQENVLTAHPFKSLSRVVRELGLDVEIVSMHSLSKGFLGECGVRGGYAVFENFDADVLAQFVKMKSIELCSNTIGQLSVGLMVRPPTADAKALYDAEKAEVLAGLSERATILTQTMNELEGISMPPIGGAMYAFPQVTLPAGAAEAAAKQGVPADEFYCMSALETTGMVVVPGSGFQQQPGTFHFRTTFLPQPTSKMEKALGAFADFHKDFMQKYA
jgi:alanine transaminase